MKKGKKEGEEEGERERELHCAILKDFYCSDKQPDR